MAMFGAVSLDGMSAKQLPMEEDRSKKFDKAIIFNLGFTGFLETPYALLLHDLSFRIEPKWFSLKARIWHIAVNPKELIRRADQLFTVSETTARDIARIYGAPQKEISTVKIGIRMTEVRREKREERCDENAPTHHSPLTTPPLSIPTPFLLVLGAGNPRKNVATAIKAFEILKRDSTFADLDLIVIGNEKKRDSRNENREAKNKTEIPPITISAPSNAELDSLYRDADIFLYPSWYEGYGLPLHEAGRFGTPCIASTDGALPETAPEGTVFVPPSKPHLWAKVMRDVLSSPDQHRTVIDLNREQSDFSNLIQWLER
jgi:glycosyltransferase involved in cell wall biosynthesis